MRRLIAMLLRGAFHPFPVGKMRPISTNWYSKCRISCINWSAERHTKTSTCFGFKVLMFNKQCLVDCCCEIGTAWLSKKTAATQGPMDRDFLVLFLGVDLPACVSEWICFWFRINCHYRDWVPLLALILVQQHHQHHRHIQQRQQEEQNCLYYDVCTPTSTISTKQQFWCFTFHTFFYFTPTNWMMIPEKLSRRWPDELRLWATPSGMVPFGWMWRLGLLTSANESWTSHSMRQKAPLSTWWLVRSRFCKISQIRFFSCSRVWCLHAVV